MRVRLAFLVAVAVLWSGCASSPDVGTDPAPEMADGPGLAWQWTRGGPTLNVALAESAAAYSNTSAHFIGGFTATGGGTPVVQNVNFTDDFSGIMLDPYPLAAHHVQAARVGRVLYSFGGYVGGVPIPGTPVMAPGWPRTDLAFKFDFDDPVDTRWVPIAPLPEARAAGAAAVVGDQVYLVGGTSPTGFHASVLRYDPASDSYTQLAPLPVPRDHLNLVSDGTSLYAIAGRVLVDGQGYDDLETFERYDVANDTWTALPPVPLGRGGQAAALANGHIVVAGGEVAEGPFDVLDAVHAYDLANGTWVALPPMPEARHGGVLVPYKDGAYYIGGASLDGTLAATSLRVSLVEPAAED